MMQNNYLFNIIKTKIKKNTEIFALALLIIITIIFTTYYNYNKQKIYNNYINTINNVYLKKTVIHILDNLEPKFKKIEHNVSNGETFDNILELYSIKKKDVDEIKDRLSKNININKLNTAQKIALTIDQSNNQLKEFIFKISNTEKIYITKNDGTNKFEIKKITTKLNKEILYKENIILQSLYNSASKQKIPANVIVEFARIYGFQVDFQRDIRKRDSFQIMYEVYKDKFSPLNFKFANKIFPVSIIFLSSFIKTSYII